MVATKYAYSKGKNLVRSFSAVFSVFFGLIALFFAGTPKLWNSDSSNQNIFSDLFTQNTAHADVPHWGDFSCGDAGCVGGESGCAGACADGSAGSCACGDGGGCGEGGATA